MKTNLVTDRMRRKEQRKKEKQIKIYIGSDTILDWYEQIIIIDEVCSVYIQRSIVQGQEYMTVGEYTKVKR